MSSPSVASESHVGDPLSASEIQLAAEAVIAAHPNDPRPRFNTISLAESSLSDVSLLEGSRAASVLLHYPSESRVVTLRISLPDGKVLSETVHSAGEHPPFTPDDCKLAEELVLQDPQVRKIVQERYRIHDAEKQLVCDPWSVHLPYSKKETHFDGQKSDSHAQRLVQTFLYRRDSPGDNHYAHPLDFLPIVDLNTGHVIISEDEKHQNGDVAHVKNIPATMVNYREDLLSQNEYLEKELRDDPPRPLQILQPEGPSFRVHGREVEWQKWKLRVGFNAREGVVLHNISYGGRSVLARASVVEMAVPYADPRDPYTRKCAFDVGDYGLGFCTNSLKLGCDCLGTIHYFDEVLNDSEGRPYTIEKAVCMHEEDAGLLYKHVEYRTGHSESRRARRLVISFIATVVNYEYLFYWYLHHDGSIALDIKLSGELSTNPLSEGEVSPTHGVLVAPGVNAQIHQHMFCARLDMAVDGPNNSVSEVDFVPAEAGPHNPAGNAFQVVSTPLRTEREAQRDFAPARTWRVSNPSSVNRISGKPVGYKLVPYTSGAAQLPLLTASNSAVTSRGVFATKALWVTPYNEKERFPAGEFPVQSKGGEGLPHWTKADRNVENQRIVLWHSFGVAHLPRTEDFPVMPCETTGFTLKPDCFFLGNPGIDLPPDSQQANSSLCCS